MPSVEQDHGQSKGQGPAKKGRRNGPGREQDSQKDQQNDCCHGRIAASFPLFQAGFERLRVRSVLCPPGFYNLAGLFHPFRRKVGSVRKAPPSDHGPGGFGNARLFKFLPARFIVRHFSVHDGRAQIGVVHVIAVAGISLIGQVVGQAKAPYDPCHQKDRQKDFQGQRLHPLFFLLLFFPAHKKDQLQDQVEKKIAPCDHQGVVPPEAAQDQGQSAQDCGPRSSFMKQVSQKQKSARSNGPCGSLGELQQKIQVLSQIQVHDGQKKEGPGPSHLRKQDTYTGKCKKDRQKLGQGIEAAPWDKGLQENQDASPQNAGKHQMGVPRPVKGALQDQLHDKVIGYLESDPAKITDSRHDQGLQSQQAGKKLSFPFRLVLHAYSFHAP